MGKEGNNNYFGEECLEWFNSSLKTYFKNDIELNPNTIIACIATKCWLYVQEFDNEDEKENPGVKDQCHLTGNFRGLAHNICILSTRRAHNSFVPIVFHIF